MADTATEETTKSTEEPAKEEKSKKAPLPKGFVTPVQFAKLLSAKENDGDETQVRPQIIYGYCKNNGPESKNPFPWEKNSDGAYMVKEADAFKWIDALRKRQAERATAKAEKEKAEAEKAKETADAS